jgi:hypothetical protein
LVEAEQEVKIARAEQEVKNLGKLMLIRTLCSGLELLGGCNLRRGGPGMLELQNVLNIKEFSGKLRSKKV